METVAKTQENVRIVADRLLFGESPRWRDDALWVSDWGANEVLRFDAAGRCEVIARVASFPMCIEHLPDGRLLIVDSAGKQLLRREGNGTLAQHADFRTFSALDALATISSSMAEARSMSTILGSDSRRRVPPRRRRPHRPRWRGAQGRGRLAFPNGMAVTPDNRTLIIAESYACRLTAFDISADGDLSGRRVWAEVSDHPDGVCPRCRRLRLVRRRREQALRSCSRRRRSPGDCRA